MSLANWAVSPKTAAQVSRKTRPRKCPVTGAIWDTSRHDRAPDRLRVSADEQDLTAQRDGLARLGVDPERIYADHGLTGTTRGRPGLREALAACREGDTLVVTKLDRLARSLPDARDIVDELTARQVKLNLGGSVHDPTDPVGRLLFNVLAMVAEADLLRMRTREGMKVARARGRLRGQQPRLSPRQEAHLVSLHNAGTHTSAGLAELFSVARSTVYRAIHGPRIAQLNSRSTLPLVTRTRAPGLLRVLELAAGHATVRYHNIVAGKRPRKIPPTPPATRGHPPGLERPPAERPWRAAYLDYSG
jgi:DNA invertase Pin-like site-specific DNA recombinase